MPEASYSTHPSFDDREEVLRHIQDHFMQWRPDEPAPPVGINPPTESLDTEFQRDFPPDAFGHEADDGARVWRVYRSQATAHDDALLDGWNGTLDIMLIFAGLFSAVATAFLIESYQTLQFDKDGFVLIALHALVAVHNQTGDAGLPLPPPVSIHPSTTTRLINGLWFTSLILALSVSLLSILVKQWLRQYKARNNASARTPRQWAHRRMVLYDTLTAWRIPDLISVLPVLLHAALFLFLAGMVLFLWDLDKAIGVVTLGISSGLVAFYLISVFLGFWYTAGPTSTPFVSLLHRAVFYGLTVLLDCLGHCYRRLNPYANATVRAFLHAQMVATMKVSVFRSRDTGVSTPHVHDRDVEMISNPRSSSDLSRASLRLRTCAAWIRLSHVMKSSMSWFLRLPAFLGAPRTLDWRYYLETSLRSEEAVIRDHIDAYDDDLDASVLIWLIAEVPDSDAVAVGLQAIGGLRPSSRAAAALRDNDYIRRLPFDAHLTQSSGDPSVVEYARVAKTWLTLQAPPVQDPLPDYGADSTINPEFGLRGYETLVDTELPPDLVAVGDSAYWRAYADWDFASGFEGLQYSKTCTSTIMCLLRFYHAAALPLLQYCDFDSPEMDCETIVYACSAVSPTTWADIPEHYPPTVTARARACRALAATFATYDSLPSDNERGNDQSLLQALVHAVVGLMATAYSDADCSDLFRTGDSENPEDFSVYGSQPSDIIRILRSPLFNPSTTSTFEWGGRETALAFLRFRMDLEAQDAAYEEVATLLDTAVRLISLANWRRSRLTYAVYRLAQVVTGPNRLQFVHHILVPKFPDLPSTIWARIADDDDRPRRYQVTIFLISELASLKESAQSAYHRPLLPLLEEAFFAHFDFKDCMRRLVTTEIEGYTSDCHELVRDLLRVAGPYRILRPEQWEEELHAAKNHSDIDYRTLALELELVMGERGETSSRRSWDAQELYDEFSRPPAHETEAAGRMEEV